MLERNGFYVPSTIRKYVCLFGIEFLAHAFHSGSELILSIVYYYYFEEVLWFVFELPDKDTVCSSTHDET